MFTVEYFPADGDTLRRQCRQCRAASKRTRRNLFETNEQRQRRLAGARTYAVVHAETVRLAQVEYRRTHKDGMSAYFRAYYEDNGERIRERARQWRLANPEAKRAANATWARANPEKVLLSGRVSKRKRRAEAQLRLFESVSTQMRTALRGGKDGRSWEAVVGFSRQQLVAHLERQFAKGMTWANFGKWHIDHILPASGFTYDSADDPEFRACWALTNLRPLWAEANIAKGDRRLHLI